MDKIVPKAISDLNFWVGFSIGMSLFITVKSLIDTYRREAHE